jgi:hypothetical protein
MITKEKIIEILHSHSYNVEDQAGNHLIVVDDDSWDEIAEQVKNCSILNVVGQSEQLACDCDRQPLRYNELGTCKYCGKQKPSEG